MNTSLDSYTPIYMQPYFWGVFLLLVFGTLYIQWYVLDVADAALLKAEYQIESRYTPIRN